MHGSSPVCAALSGLPAATVAWIEHLDLPPPAVIAQPMLFSLAPGSIFDTIAAIVLTPPFVYPLVAGLGFDPIRWSVINILVIEPGLNAASSSCWEGHGFEIRATSGPEPEASAFHPIHAMGETGALNAGRRLSELDVVAILMLGEGMATLGPLLSGRRQGLARRRAKGAPLRSACRVDWLIAPKSARNTPHPG